MKVQVMNTDGAVLWCHGIDKQGNRSGMTSLTYLNDGTHQEILAALVAANDQALAEWLSTNDLNGVTNAGRASPQINGDIPIA